MFRGQPVHLGSSGPFLSKPSAAGHEYKCTGGNAQLVDQFPDQFACWDFGGMDVRKTMHSTLIRLPLRTEAMAETSSLSKVPALPAALRSHGRPHG